MVQVDRLDPEIWAYRVSVEVLGARVAWVEADKVTLDFEGSLQQPPHSQSPHGTRLAGVDVSIV